MEVLTISKKISFFKLQYSAAIRVWHWLTFLFITGSMVTVLFASTLFEHHGPKPPVAQAQGQSVQKQNEEPKFDPSKQSPEDKAAHMYANKIWDVHKIIGFGLCFLLLTRVVIEVSRKKEERLVTKINKALAIQDKQQRRWPKQTALCACEMGICFVLCFDFYYGNNRSYFGVRSCSYL